MALTLALDHDLRTILEPGFQQHFSAQRIRDIGLPEEAIDTRRIFVCPVTGTIMLHPLNIRPDWVNTEEQVASIIRAPDLTFHPDDVDNGTIFEEQSYGNPSNRYIYHRSVPFSTAPYPGAPVPGAAPSIVGAPIGAGPASGLTTIERQNEVPIHDWTPDTPVGDEGDGRFLCFSKGTLEANAPLFFRWWHPNPLIGHQTRYLFYMGQLAIEIVGNTVILWSDVSPGGDRSSMARLWGKPMFGAADYSPAPLGFDARTDFHAAWRSIVAPNEGERSLCVIPYFRHRVLLIASSGAISSVPVRAAPQPAPAAVLSGPAADRYTYEITRADKLAVWVVTPAPGRFQLQRVKFALGDPEVTARVKLPPITIDYAPADLPTIAFSADEDHDTDIEFIVDEPPGYDFPINELTSCPVPSAPEGAQTRTYGVRLHLRGVDNQLWSPFFYGLSFRAPTVFQDALTTPVLVGDGGLAASNIQDGFLSIGERPGDGRLEVGVLDESPYALDSYAGRVSVPLNLSEDGTSLFTGLTDRIRTVPLHETGRPRQVQFLAVDRWKQLADYYLRDQRDWTGFGHIDVVLFVAQQAGIDAGDTEFPVGYTPGVISPDNTRLGGVLTRVDQEARQLNPGWQPRDEDTAATFIQRIATLYSGWDVGFRADGTFFYLPKGYFSTVSLRFFHSRAAAITASLPNNPVVRNVVEFDPIEPGANITQVIGASDKQGQVLRSGLAIDFASIRNPQAVNFLGRPKPLVVILGGVFNCEELNRINRVVFDEVRRRRRRLAWVADLVPTLKLQQIVEVGTYGFYRIKSIKADLVRGNWHPANYLGERVESGYGLG